ncbi:hypothetical protein BN3590_02753 [Clostridium sp. C105KSO15]|nr:hypothetical protein BN3590_02753 [Clostridium sp. C105KSO15]
MTNQMLASKMLLLMLQDKGRITMEKEGKSFGKPVQGEMPSELMQYAGTYAASDSQIEVKMTKKVELTLSSEPDTAYLYTEDGNFLSSDGNSQMRFVQEKNGRIYLWKRSYDTDMEFVQVADSQYIAEKLEDNAIPEQIAKIWKERDGKMYYILNQKYSSDAYVLDYPAFEIRLEERRATGQIERFWMRTQQFPRFGFRDWQAETRQRQDSIAKTVQIILSRVNSFALVKRQFLG